MHMFRTIYQGFEKVERILTKFLIISITLLTFGSALSRMFGFPLPWSLELTLLLFAWFAFLAASQSSRRQTHLGVDILTMRLPKRIQKIIEIINNILIIGFLAILGYAALTLSIKSAPRQITSLQISFSAVTISVCVGCLLMMISEWIHLVRRIVALASEMTALKSVGNGGRS